MSSYRVPAFLKLTYVTSTDVLVVATLLLRTLEDDVNLPMSRQVICMYGKTGSGFAQINNNNN